MSLNKKRWTNQGLHFIASQKAFSDRGRDPGRDWS
jgi:hypothetical protein